MSNHEKHQGEELFLVLAGNPNVGKSAVFQSLTGSYADISNFPGTTVEVTRGLFKQYTIIDTPGVYGISSFNEEERVTMEALEQADLILNVVDAVHLERDLFLTIELVDLGKPMIVALNMMDELQRQGFRIDIPLLSRLLGLPVIPISARNSTGLDQLKTGLQYEAKVGKHSPVVGRSGSLRTLSDVQYRILQQYSQSVCNGVFHSHSHMRTRSEQIGDLLLAPLTAVPLLLAIIGAVFLFLGTVIAQYLVRITDDLIMGTWYYNFITSLLSSILDPDNFLGSLLYGEFGLLTMVPMYLFGLLLPLVLGFYLVMSFLEDSGILPRISVLLDGLFSQIGLNGKAVIPMILGFGCVTAALLSTRILGSSRERLIASILLCVAVPCSAQLGILVSIATTLHPIFLLQYLGIMIAVFLLLGFGLQIVLPGASTDLLLDLPPIRLPLPGNILKKTTKKTQHFLLDTAPIFAVASLLLSVLHQAGGFAALRVLFSPLTVTLLELPDAMTNVFLLSIIKKDLGAAALFDLARSGALTQQQTVTALLVTSLFVPCLASGMMLIRERGPWEAALIWTGSMIIAVVVGAMSTLCW